MYNLLPSRYVLKGFSNGSSQICAVTEYMSQPCSQIQGNNTELLMVR